MSAELLKQKLAQGEIVYGTLIQNTISPSLVNAIPAGTLDFVIVSDEHTAFDIGDFLAMRYAFASKGIACLARTHSRSADDVAKVCDTYDGVVVPYVEDYEECQELAAAAVYRPLKGAALNNVLSKGEWPTKATQDYVENRNRNTLFVPMIESVRGVENLARICSIPGVAAVFVGPNDMTVNMGIPNQYDHRDFIAILQRIIDTANARHVAAGCWFGNEAQALRTIRQGARFVVFSNDGLLFRNAISESFGNVKKG
ncbi:MAG: aldolase/citrate lyase family protein [Verrucomicrobiota bacterium]